MLWFVDELGQRMKGPCDVHSSRFVLVLHGPAGSRRFQSCAAARRIGVAGLHELLGCIPHDRRLELGLKFAELLVDQPQRIAAVAALQAVESMCQDVAEDYRRGGLPWQQSRDDE